MYPDQHWFNDAQCYILGDILFDSPFPVLWIWDWSSATVGVVPETKIMFRGRPFILCSNWCGHTLNVLDPNFSSIHCSNWRLLFSIGVNRILASLGGTVVLQGHPHRSFPSLLVVTFYCEVGVRKWEVIGLDPLELIQPGRIQSYTKYILLATLWKVCQSRAAFLLLCNSLLTLASFIHC